MNPYENCPILEDERYRLRLLCESDADDLLRVYSDEKAVPLFNDDNCTGGFYFTAPEHMQGAIQFWLESYRRREFVRFTIVDKYAQQAVGTIELFNRRASDAFDNCAILRLDLRSDYEREEEIEAILSLIVPQTFDLFACGKIATKAIPTALERIQALKKLGFAPSEEKLIGHDGMQYGHYHLLSK